jgi:hypothetical protein
MEKRDFLAGNRGRKGSAMIVVLLAMMVLLPLALTLLLMVSSRLQASVDYRDQVAGEAAARAGFEEAAARLATGEAALSPGEAFAFETEIDALTVEVRLSREPDAFLTLSGALLGRLETGEVDLSLASYDAEGRRVFLYRKLEIYLVESTVHGRPALPAVRLLGVLGRQQDGSLAPVGLTIERGFFDPKPARR